MKSLKFFLATFLMLFFITGCSKASATIELKNSKINVILNEEVEMEFNIADLKSIELNEVMNNMVYTPKNQDIVEIIGGKIKGKSVGTSNVKITNKLLNKVDLTMEVNVTNKVSSITYNLDGGVLPDNAIKTYEEGKVITLPTPNKEGHTFLGWKINSGEVIVTQISDSITGDLTLKAFWSLNDFNITYNLDGGTNPENSPTGGHHNQTVLLPIPTKEHSNFLGWTLVKGETGYVTEIIITANITVYANWELASYDITYNLSGGINHAQAVTSAKYNTKINLLSPTKEHFNFLGWTLVEGGTSYVTEITVTNHITLYANWEGETFQITYNLFDGINSENALSSAKYGQKVTLLNPTKAGFSFLGWSLTENSGVYITEVTITGNVTLYANWGPLRYTISYIYSEGDLSVKKASNLTEFYDFFWKDYHKWSKYTGTVEEFKAAILASDFTTKYPLYKMNKKNIIDEGAFVNSAQYAPTWMNFMNELDRMVTDMNGSQDAWNSTYVGNLRLAAFFNLLNKPSSLWTEARTKVVMNSVDIPVLLPTSYVLGERFDIPNLTITDGRTFEGWFDNDGNKVERITADMEKNLVLTARWSASTPLTGFEVTNQIEKILRLTSHELEFTFTPANATNKRVTFTSSNPKILTIDKNGKINALKDGKVEIKVTPEGNTALEVKLEVEVYVEKFITGSFEDLSTVVVGQTIKFIANEYHNPEDTLVYMSEDSTTASVDNNGVITGVSSGTTKIVIALESDRTIKLEVTVTVLSNNQTDLEKLIVGANNSSIHIREDLHVAYAYYTNVYGSVSNLLFEGYIVDDSYPVAQGSSNRPGTIRSSTEFITVHYTANTGKNSTAAANAKYFQTAASTSIHYVVGNDGIYSSLPDNEVGYHAGDGTSVKFEWLETKVAAASNTKPKWGVIKDASSSTGYYFTLNGVKSICEVPIKGKSSSGKDMTIEDPANAFSFQGPAWKVVDGKYYMGKTWACFTQKLSGVISSYGGNLNSVGIETAVNEGADLWLTNHKTAKLVARLLVKYNLDLSRVVAHNFFSGKDCPQTLLANEGELWHQFMKLVEVEYQLLKLQSDYKLSIVSNSPDIVNNQGRIIKIPYYTQIVTYTVTIKNASNEIISDITLSSVVKGLYTK